MAYRSDWALLSIKIDLHQHRGIIQREFNVIEVRPEKPRPDIIRVTVIFGTESQDTLVELMVIIGIMNDDNGIITSR